MSKGGSKKPTPGDAIKAVTEAAEEAVEDFKKGFQGSTQLESKPIIQPPISSSAAIAVEFAKKTVLQKETRLNKTVDLSRPSSAEKLGHKASKVVVKSKRQLRNARRKIKSGIRAAVKEKNRRISKLSKNIAIGKKDVKSFKEAKGVGQKIGYGRELADVAMMEIKDLKRKIDDEKNRMKEEMKHKFDESKIGKAFNEKMKYAQDLKIELTDDMKRGKEKTEAGYVSFVQEGKSIGEKIGIAAEIVRKPFERAAEQRQEIVDKQQDMIKDTIKMSNDAVDIASKTFTAGFKTIRESLQEAQKITKGNVSDVQKQVKKRFKPK